MPKAFLAVGMVVASLVIVGCGGGDDDSGGGEEALTKVEFIAQGDAICEQAQEQAEAGGEDFAEENGFELEKATDEQLEEAVAAVVVPALEQQADEIGALGAPEGDEERVEAIVVALEDGAATVAADPSVVFEGSPLKEASDLAKEYGFEACGEE